MNRAYANGGTEFDETFLAFDKTGLFFTAAEGGAAPDDGTVVIEAVDKTRVVATVTAGITWTHGGTPSPAATVTPEVLQPLSSVSVAVEMPDPDTLGEGTYDGTLTVTFTGLVSTVAVDFPIRYVVEA